MPITALTFLILSACGSGSELRHGWGTPPFEDPRTDEMVDVDEVASRDTVPARLVTHRTQREETSSLLTSVSSLPPVFRTGGPGGSLRPGLAAASSPGQEGSHTPGAWSVAGLSALLPGAGQGLLHERRGIVYAATEVFLWVARSDRRSRSRTLATRYRDLAWSTARGGTGPRVDGDFPYYERLLNWERSGAFDTDPGIPGTQPEVDDLTFNGSVWAVARGLFFGGDPNPTPAHPGWASALEYYTDRAVTDAFIWDWTGLADDRVEYGALVERSDEASRSAVIFGAAIALNHLGSAIDGWLSARSRARASSEGLAIEALLPSAVSVVPAGRADHGPGVQPRSGTRDRWTLVFQWMMR